MALSPPQPLDGQRVLRISGPQIGSTTKGSADPGGGSTASAHGNGKSMDAKQEGRRGKEVLRVATVNVGSLTGKGGELVKMMEDRRLSIACIQETRWRGNSARELGNGYKLLYAGEVNGRNGVGVVFHRDVKDSIVEVIRRSSRLMLVKVVWKGEIINIVSAYAPQVGQFEQEKKDFWSDFDDMIFKIDKRERLIIGGDLNGHVGARCGSYREFHGNEGFGTLNKEGLTILDAVTAHDLYVVNTKFKKKEQHLVTFMSPVGRSQIDYFLVRKENLRECKDCKVLPGETLDGHHRLLILELWMKVKAVKRKRVMEEGIKWKKLKKSEDTLREKMLAEVDWCKEGSVEFMWKNLAGEVRSCCRKVLGEYKSGTTYMEKETWWWSDEVDQAVKEKKKAYKMWQKSRLSEDCEKYEKAKKIAKRVVAKAKSDSFKAMYNRLETREGERDIYKLAKERAVKKRDIVRVKCIKGENGEVIVDDTEIRKRWGKYFNTVMNDGVSETVSERGDSLVFEVEEQVQEITCDEVEKVLKKMKRGKAVGPDDIPVEVWKLMGKTGICWLTRLFNKMLKGDTMPEEWRSSYVIPLYKGKGDVQECKNYRGIKLLSHTMKLWERVIEGRLRKITSVNENQFGFMPGKSTMEPIFIVRQLMEKFREAKKSMYLVFVDLEKAYDKVPRKVLWEVLNKKGIGSRYIEVVKDMYKDSKTSVRTVGGISEGFGVGIGVHQGSALSPYLFVLVMDELLKGNVREVPWCMLFADDMILIGETLEEVKERLQRVMHALESNGMKINRDKTEFMFCDWVGDGQVQELRVQEWNLNKVEQYKYLGSLVEEKGGVEKEIDARLQAGWNKWREVSGVLCDKSIPRRLRGKVYTTMVRPVMLYGAECWAVTGKQEHKVGVAEMRMLRGIFGVTRKDRFENEYIREGMGVNCIEQKMRECRLRWYGHVNRKGSEEVVSRVRSIDLGVRRGRGRPKTTWGKVLEKDMAFCGLGRDMVWDRDEWRRSIKMPTLAKLGQRQGR